MNPRAPNRSEQGTSFAELMLASMIIGTTLVATTSSMTESAEVYHFFSDGPHEALMLAQEIHEAAVLLPWEEAGDSSFGDDVDTIWDFHETTFHPPRSAEYEKVKSHVTWRQQVEVRHVDMDDPTVVVDPDEFEGDTLVELRVHVVELDGVYETWDEEDPEPGVATDFGWFTWWMSEPTVEEDA
jgi:hypothetical protein